MSHRIRQVIRYTASASDVYNALTQSRQFADVTGKPADISTEVGGEFTAFDGMITGRHIELISGQRIVQAWRVSLWPEGTWSIVKFELGSTEEGTELQLEHSGFPDDAYDHINEGWYKMYWEPLREFLAKQGSA